MSIIYFNNKFIEDTDNIAESYAPWNYRGIGVFDSMLAIDNVPQDIDYHLERLNHDIKAVLPEITFSIDKDDAIEIYKKLLDKNDLAKGQARIRTVIAMNNNDVVLLVCTMPARDHNTDTLTCAIIKDYPRESGNPLENCKRLNYSRSFDARAKAQELGADEAILTNTDGNIACGATSNIFIEENGVLITPPLSDGVLAGVTRRKLIEERDIKEESISLERLKAADKIYLTNSFMGLREVILR